MFQETKELMRNQSIYLSATQTRHTGRCGRVSEVPWLSLYSYEYAMYDLAVYSPTTNGLVWRCRDHVPFQKRLANMANCLHSACNMLNWVQ